MATMSRRAYAAMFGPTTGDQVRLETPTGETWKLELAREGP